MNYTAKSSDRIGQMIDMPEFKPWRNYEIF